MVAWAQDLQPGPWFTWTTTVHRCRCNTPGKASVSNCTFAAVDGNYLIQLRRLGQAYPQAGLLVAQDEEGLALRATRCPGSCWTPTRETIAGPMSPTGRCWILLTVR